MSDAGHTNQNGAPAGLAQAPTTGSVIPEGREVDVANALMKAGVPRQTVLAALKADGYSVEAWQEPGPTKPPTAAQEYDASSLASATDPSAYTAPQWFLHPATVTPDLATAINAAGQDAAAQQGALENSLRQGMALVGIPAAAGRGTMELMADSARRFAGLSDADKSALRQEARAAVERVYGADAAKEYTAVLQAWRSRSPAVVDALIHSDYFSDPRVLGQLVLRGRMSKARSEL